MSTNVDELLAKARKPVEDAMRLHPFYRGKMETNLKVPIRSFDDFAIWYTPGVAEPCKYINKNKELVYDYTSKWNTVMVATDGTRVLGLGNIGPEAGLPVMEGKCLLYKYLGGVDAFPIAVSTKDAEKFIDTIKLIQPSFGGVNLEDIEQPKCFYILDRLRAECEIPVWHDDEQGTATVVLSGVKNALKVVGKKLDQVLIAMIGAGAANISVARLLLKAGAKPGNIMLTDSKGILNRDRIDVKDRYPQKWEMCQITNSEQRKGGIAEAMKSADMTIAMSTPVPGTIKPEWVKSMASSAIVFACANPLPEIWPWDAKGAGAKVVATGRSDFTNQVNNSLGFPGIFRGTLDVRAKTITDEMCIAAAEELATVAEDQGLSEDCILPTMENVEVYIREAVAVGMKAQEQDIARKKMSRSQLHQEAEAIIKRSRALVVETVKAGFIAKSSS